MLLSTGTWIIFDPRNFLSENNGLTIELGEDDNLEYYGSELESFHINEFDEEHKYKNALAFDKTIFRLPLRTKADVKGDIKISDSISSIDNVLSLMRDPKFQEKAKKFLLFLNNVKKLEFKYIPQGEKQSKLILSVS